ncbi:3-oxo-tetronate 4-phosphate decarboxylase [Mycolicibacterium brisbanense]|uniref:3-oxo-tetronate 4-phosphate decarboxylase n=1 Tax=Mycolicibacterium brisbanense TaxID=146020 RepID=A0A100W4R4_9MYCO|nr:aldolase [Mycolicibacterium brisbanense]MCV7161169.1 aldolase [Mycolicibacterium brisbanense]GAS91598.1 aldolase [Mycolicibacterium brisbanense]
MSFDDAARTQMVRLGAALYDRGLTPGRTGNLSVRMDDQIMITPTNACLGRLEPERLAVMSVDGEHLAGDRPSKELVLHRAFYRHHPTCTAVAHLHSTSAVAVSCLPGLRCDDALPPITPYFVMRVGRLPLIDYGAPGSAELEELVSRAAKHSRSVLMRNHGSFAAAKSLESAVDAVEEIEETARLYLLLAGRSPVYLGEEAVAELHRRYPSTA